jgi:heme exporter protein B
MVYLSFESMLPNTWNVMFWIILLFTSVNAIAKSFVQESANRFLYYYSIAGPHAIILAKAIYNTLVMLFLTALGIGFYALIAGFPVRDPLTFFSALTMGALAYSLIFSMISAIASKANNSSMIMAILSFPLILPVIKLLIDISSRSLLVKDFQASISALLTLLALDILILALALILFPYLWRD